MYSFKKVCKVLIDAILISISLIISYKLRLEHNVPNNFQNWYWSLQLPFVLPVVTALRVSSLFIFQIYSRMWRYTELNELIELLKPIAFSSLILALPRVLGFSPREELFAIPTSVIVMDTALCIILLSISRILRKVQIENRNIRKRQLLKDSTLTKRTLLIGAGQAGQELARKVIHHPELGIEIVCALDDDQKKESVKIIENLRVVGKIKDLNKAVKDFSIEQIIIAIPSLPPNKIREIVELCQNTKLETKIIPGVDQLAGGQVTIEQIRKISLEDLLGREPVDLSLPEIENFINDKSILITGAGGSIGSELVRQLVKNFKPKKLYLLGRGEGSIFEICQELKSKTKIEFSPIICDIRNYKLLNKQIKKTKPDLIFHAAAHKHVPLMEDHPQEAFENNVLGTKNIAEIAGINNVKTFINISTDKAVNPINVLGCTKRMAELAVNSISKQFPSTKYISVRFGNVIGSRGSVIPIWQNQLKNNMPITITDKEAYRFFMTLQEASQLVIKASAIGNPGEIMVLDMGEEVNIYKIANDFIKLSGYDEGQIKIEVTGLRPGEKLREELVGYYEGTVETSYKKILVINTKELSADIETTIHELSINTENQSEQEFRESIIARTKKLNESINKSKVLTV